MPESQHDLPENRKQFQLERMILFSDAVFAIVITLLVIEIKIPELVVTGIITEHQMREHLVELIPQLIGFVMSFFLVGMFWTMHHRLFGYIIDFDARLIWLNLLTLLMVAFLPFSTSLVSQHGYLDISFIIYSFNLGMISLMIYFIWKYITKVGVNLTRGLDEVNTRKLAKRRSITIAFIFFSGTILCLFNVTFLSWMGRFIFLLIFPANMYLRKAYRTKKAVVVDESN